MERMEPFDGNPSWIMILLLICLAATLGFVSFGLGVVNLAGANQGAPQEQQLRAELDQKRTQLTQRQQTLERLREQTERLKKEVDQRKASLANQAGEQEQETQSLADRERRLQDLWAQIAHQERQAEAVRQAIAEKTAVPVGQIYGRPGAGKVPQWVECVKDVVVLQPRGERVSVEALQQQAPAFLEAFRHKGYVVFLVRPQGFESFAAARQLAAGAGMTVGYEPVDEDWVLNFGGGHK